MSRPDAAADVPFLDRARETAPPDSLRRWQWERLAAGVGEIWGSNAFWRGRLQAAGVRDPRDVGSWADFARLPRLTKAELAADQAAHPPFTPTTRTRSTATCACSRPRAPRARRYAGSRRKRRGRGGRAAGPSCSAERGWGRAIASLPVLVRPLRRLLGRTRRRPGSRRDEHPRGRPGLRDAAPRDPGPRRHGPRLHAVLPGSTSPRSHAPRAPTPPRSASAPRSTRASPEPESRPCAVAWSRSGERERTIMRA